MSDPPRLLDQPGTGQRALSLLRALEPPQAAPPSVKAALVSDLSGLVAGAGSKAAGIAWWVKASLVGALALGGGGALYLAREVAPAPLRAPARPIDVATSTPAPSAPAPVARPQTPAPPAASSPATPLEKPKNAASPAPRDLLAEEEALVEAARKALASQPSRALSLLRKHQSQFPNGQLSAERLYLSVDALQRLGELSAAKREAAKLTKYYPNSAYARRVPQLLGAVSSQ